ncbi:MAG: DNA sulfur modification protein DndB [Nannocystaceae bacterium]
MSFGIQWQSFFGTFGQFRINTAKRGDVTACYVQTRIRAAKDGQWDSILTQYMRPWREVFAVERMTFDELLQRDLDDARVANDLIPYLMGTEASRYPVFPPILAVLAPSGREGERAGIERFYSGPKPSAIGRQFGDVFDTGPMQIDGADSPIHQVKYNPQRSTFVIVDGQHRAMALLALFRQLGGSKDWNADPHATYYSHLKPKADQIAHIQLPVCVLYFPGIYEDSDEYTRNESDLTAVCRQIFLDVNKQARRVSVARERLLDDSSFPPMLMRSVLSRLRSALPTPESAKIYSFDYGRDDGSDQDRNVVTAATEYSSSHTLFVAMGALCFGFPDAFDLVSTTDVTQGNNRRNPLRPVRLLSERWNRPTLSVRLAEELHVDETRKVVTDLAALWYPLLPEMFHELRPYRIHNKVLHQLGVELSSPANTANTALNEARGMIFDSGGNRAVFERHMNRMEEIIADGVDNSYRPLDIVKSNFKYCQTVLQARQTQESRFKRQRAYAFWQMKEDAFREGTDDDRKVVQAADEIYRAFSNQAVQLGYVMAVATLAHLMLKDAPSTYEENQRVIAFAAQLFANTTNMFFSPGDEVPRESLKQGLFSKPRVKIFSPQGPGLRMLFNANKSTELNERAWPFFRYAFFEILYAQATASAHTRVVKKASEDVRTLYLDVLGSVLEKLLDRRKHWRDRFVHMGLTDPEFVRKVEREYDKNAAKDNEEKAHEAKLSAEKIERERLEAEAKDMLKASIEAEKDLAALEAQVRKGL